MKAYKIITGEDPDQFKSEEGQFAKALATDAQKKNFLELCKVLGVNYKDILQEVGVTGAMTAEQHGRCLHILKDIENGKR